jgi:hypothetical protein
MVGSSMKPDKYYSTDLRISIVEIVAKNEKQAEAIMQKFIDEIAVVMDTVVRWDEADWEIQKHILDKNKGEWITT